ncbi:MAG TPA: hypothetical protein VHH53_12700 [Pseudonocardiaceae bacterium]|nr:hypothetical protein [Pseudonocardiaceae bacterium]
MEFLGLEWGQAAGFGDQRRGQDTDGLAIGEGPEGGGADQYFLPRTGGAVKDGEQLCAVTVAVQTQRSAADQVPG